MKNILFKYAQHLSQHRESILYIDMLSLHGTRYEKPYITQVPADAQCVVLDKGTNGKRPLYYIWDKTSQWFGIGTYFGRQSSFYVVQRLEKVAKRLLPLSVQNRLLARMEIDPWWPQ